MGRDQEFTIIKFFFWSNQTKNVFIELNSTKKHGIPKKKKILK